MSLETAAIADGGNESEPTNEMADQRKRQPPASTCMEADMQSQARRRLTVEKKERRMTISAAPIAATGQEGLEQSLREGGKLYRY
jgi:hypothetical protein